MSAFSVHTPNATHTIITFSENVLGGADAVELASIIRTSCATAGMVVVLDLAEVKVMNSSGLGMLVGSLSTTSSLSASLVLVGVPEKVQSLLDMTQLTQVFDIRASIEAALADV